MLKKYLLSVVIVFVLWSVLDFVIHGVILSSAYQATAQLWRPMPEMKMGLMRFVTLIIAAIFVGTYTLLVNPKSVKTGVFYGLLMGLISGVSMGVGSYGFMPITVQIAVVWFLGSFIQMTLAGLCIGTIIKSSK
ncbi:MAG: hypothetical protein Q7T18_03730 [Sedimentisphaerales bacterium]|nr:hypothetical protein [Sedimentisphaerales bacterium]